MFNTKITIISSVFRREEHGLSPPPFFMQLEKDPTQQNNKFKCQISRQTPEWIIVYFLFITIHKGKSIKDYMK